MDSQFWFHQLDLGDARDYAPGMFFLRLTQAGRTLSRRVVIAGHGSR